jgi:hypothetical protein
MWRDTARIGDLLDDGAGFRAMGEAGEFGSSIVTVRVPLSASAMMARA